MNSLTGISRRRISKELIARLQSTSPSASTDIKIPNRIERGPTDILKALDSTVSRDPTAAHYKYHDDPYLIPISSKQRRIYAIAYESGKRTAQWVFQEHSDLFVNKCAEPEIKAFMPRSSYLKEDEVSEEILLNLIQQADIVGATNVYDLLKKNVSVQTKLSLLQMLCFYNNVKPLPAEFQEEKWFKLQDQVQKNNWRFNPMLEELFEFLKDQDIETAGQAYSIVICGTTKHFNASKAFELYKQSIEQNIPLSLEAYNAMILNIKTITYSTEQRKEMLYKIYSKLSAEGLQPNLYTLNASLKLVSCFEPVTDAIKSITDIFATFRELGVKPSLGSYTYVFKVYRQIGDATRQSVIEILDEIEKETFTIQHPDDVFFFPEAMEIASQVLYDQALGERIHKLYLTGDNYKFLANNILECWYYRWYILLLLAKETIETFFKQYYELVPNIYIPETNLMIEILKTIELHPPAVIQEHLPKLWSHVLMFDFVDRDDVVSQLLHTMRARCSLPNDSPLHEIFAEAALTIWNHKQVTQTRRSRFTPWQATLIGDIAILLLRNNNLEKVTEVLSFLNTQHEVMISEQLSIEQINELTEKFIVQGQTPAALNILQYAVNNNYQDAPLLARKIYKSLVLSPAEENKIVNLVGKEVLEAEVSTEM